MKAIAYRQHQIAAVFALSFAAVGFTVPTIADAGNVKSGNTEVSQVLGRSSSGQISGGSIATSGQDHAALGRSNGSSHGSAAQRVATRSANGLLEMAGGGSTPAFTQAKADSASKVASNR